MQKEEFIQMNGLGSFEGTWNRGNAMDSYRRPSQAPRAMDVVAHNAVMAAMRAEYGQSAEVVDSTTTPPGTESLDDTTLKAVDARFEQTT